MRKLISNTALVAIAAGGMLFASCGDHDMYNPNYKAEEYALNWEQKIGAVDPNQDWSMATSVTATFNVAAAGNGVLNIYTNNPILPSSRLLAKVFLNNGSGSATFDAVKGADQVFVVASNNGKNVVYGWADIVNGQVNAGKTVAKKAAKTRAGETCPVTIGETTVTNVQYESTVPYGYWWNYQEKTLEEWEQIYKDGLNNLKNYNPGPFTTESITEITTDEWGNWLTVKLDFSNPVLKSDAHIVYAKDNISLTMLNGVEQTAVEPWAVSWGWELFGDPNAFFKEGVRYDDDKKAALPGFDLEEVKKGFSITTEGGEINVPFIFGATQKTNRFGYVYYKEGQDPLTQPHYILMNDGQPLNNIYFNSWPGDATGSDGMGLANWNEAEKCYYNTTPETLVYGTNYKLSFFGENHDQAATYNFPTGYKIMFFIVGMNVNDNSYDAGRFNYSLSELNKRIGHKFYDKNGTEHPEQGAVKATAWTYNGHVYMGFEDGGNDEDLNDIVFWVEGDFTPNQEIPEIPSTTTPQERVQSWILACEDLGSTDDYDFNDIVLEVRQTVATEEVKEGDRVKATNFKSAKLQIRCLAAGGIYPANITYVGNNENIVTVGESHALLGGQPGTMINTTAPLGAFSNWVDLETITDKEQWEATDWSINTIAEKIKIVVTINDKESAGAAVIERSERSKGNAPQMIIVHGDWKWPKERTKIEDAYSEFKLWNGNAAYTEWYEHFNTEAVINR